MRLPRIVRTTSFRLTLLYAGLFCTSVLILFAAMYWYGTGYLAGQIDRSVDNEIAELQTNAKGRGLAGLTETVAAYARQAPGRRLLLSEQRTWPSARRQCAVTAANRGDCQLTIRGCVIGGAVWARVGDERKLGSDGFDPNDSRCEIGSSIKLPPVCSIASASSGAA